MKNNGTQAYIKVTKSFVLNPKLSSPAKLLYICLNGYCNPTDNTCSPTRSSICNNLGITETTLSKYLKELRDNGYITWENRSGKGTILPNVYTILQ